MAQGLPQGYELVPEGYVLEDAPPATPKGKTKERLAAEAAAADATKNKKYPLKGVGDSSGNGGAEFLGDWSRNLGFDPNGESLLDRAKSGLQSIPPLLDALSFNQPNIPAKGSPEDLARPRYGAAQPFVDAYKTEGLSGLTGKLAAIPAAILTGHLAASAAPGLAGKASPGPNGPGFQHPPVPGHVDAFTNAFGGKNSFGLQQELRNTFNVASPDLRQAEWQHLGGRHVEGQADMHHIVDAARNEKWTNSKSTGVGDFINHAGEMSLDPIADQMIADIPVDIKETDPMLYAAKVQEIEKAYRGKTASPEAVNAMRERSRADARSILAQNNFDRVAAEKTLTGGSKVSENKAIRDAQVAHVLNKTGVDISAPLQEYGALSDIQQSLNELAVDPTLWERLTSGHTPTTALGMKAKGIQSGARMFSSLDSQLKGAFNQLRKTGGITPTTPVPPPTSLATPPFPTQPPPAAGPAGPVQGPPGPVQGPNVPNMALQRAGAPSGWTGSVPQPGPALPIPTTRQWSGGPTSGRIPATITDITGQTPPAQTPRQLSPPPPPAGLLPEHAQSTVTPTGKAANPPIERPVRIKVTQRTNPTTGAKEHVATVPKIEEPAKVTIKDTPPPKPPTAGSKPKPPTPAPPKTEEIISNTPFTPAAEKAIARYRELAYKKVNGKGNLTTAEEVELQTLRDSFKKGNTAKPAIGGPVLADPPGPPPPPPAIAAEGGKPATPKVVATSAPVEQPKPVVDPARAAKLKVAKMQASSEIDALQRKGSTRTAAETARMSTLIQLVKEILENEKLTGGQ